MLRAHSISLVCTVIRTFVWVDCIVSVLNSVMTVLVRVFNYRNGNVIPVNKSVTMPFCLLNEKFLVNTNLLYRNSIVLNAKVH